MRAKARERFRRNGKGERISEGWFVFVYEGDGRKSRRVKEETAARAIADQLNAEGEAADRWFEGGPLPLDETMRGWIAIYGKTLSPATEETHRGSIETLLIPYFGARDLRGIGREDLIAFTTDRFDEGKSAATIKNALSALRRVYSLHFEAGHLDANPARNCGQLVAQIGLRYADQGAREVDAWTREETDALLDVAREREKAVYPVLFAELCTGMRRGELLALRWEHVGKHEIRVRDSLVNGKIKTPKSGLARAVPISGDLSELLKELRRTRKLREGAFSEPDYVFTNANGNRWNEENFSRSWRRLRTRCVDDKDIKLRALSFHCCRHTFASWALDAGKSITCVQRALGHSDAATTLRCYAHFVPEEKPDMGFLKLVHRTETGPNRTEIREPKTKRVGK
jgi:integrase